MGVLKFWFCLVLLLVVVSSSDSRLLPPTLPVKGNDELIEQAKEIIRARMQRDGMSASLYAVSDRYSPGGPDPHHH
ncbi:hypothetical protein RND81_12G235700 [Saponaria officinalis]|uniref:CLAVATA3/ESR (CLE)-related protein n=1 Tax=Saponaria officinalis TaxID=3572 RepID=A0AAW1HEG5_SAPOF